MNKKYNNNKILKPIRTLFLITINTNKTSKQIIPLGRDYMKGFKAIHWLLNTPDQFTKFVIGDDPVKVLGISTNTEIGSKQHRVHVHIALTVNKLCRLDYKRFRRFVYSFYPQSHINIKRIFDQIQAAILYSEKGHFNIAIDNKTNQKIFNYDK